MRRIDRQNDLVSIIEGLDITPSMYQNAVEKYTSIASYLNNHGLSADMYPQGSFALGTVVKPIARKPNAAYDLDVICQVYGSRDNIEPKDLWNQVGDILMDSDLYGGKLVVCDKCFTIEYADIGGYGFSIDIVPATDESEDHKMRLCEKSPSPELIDTAIAIPVNEAGEDEFSWTTNNPKGYREWFHGINKHFAEHSWSQNQIRILNESGALFESVEEIPRELNRSAVQRVIQILKYHRDVYYGKIPTGEELRPASIILNTLVARIAQTASPHISIFDLLDYVTQELAIYAKHQFVSEAVFASNHSDKKVIEKREGRWFIENPANPEDNLTDAWNVNSNIPARFFMWAATVREDLVESLGLLDEDFRARAEAAFGVQLVEKTWGRKYQSRPARPITHSNSAKPWGEI